MNECKPLVAGFEPTTVMYDRSWWGPVQSVPVLATSSTISCAGTRGLHSFTSELKLSTFGTIHGSSWVTWVTKTAQVELKCERV